MTYKNLKAALEQFTPEQLQCDVTIVLEWEEEVFPVNRLGFADATDDVLDENHPFLLVK